MFDPTVDALALPHCAKGEAVCIAELLNVRDEPTVEGSEVMGQLERDQVVTVWAVDGGWCIVQADDGLTGWASAGWLDIGPLVA